MGKWKVSHHGATEEFLRSHVSDDTDACLEWPYAKNDKGLLR